MSYGSTVDVKFVCGDDVYVVFPKGVMVGPIRVKSVNIPGKIPFYEVVVPDFVTGQASRVINMPGDSVFETEYDARKCLDARLRDQEKVTVSLTNKTVDGGREIEQEYTRGTNMREALADLCIRIGFENQDVIWSDDLVFGEIPGDDGFKEMPEWKMDGKVERSWDLEAHLKSEIRGGQVEEAEELVDDE